MCDIVNLCDIIDEVKNNDNSDGEQNFDWPSDDGSFHQQEWDETEDFDYNYGGGNDADADEEVHDVNADYEAADTENNDMAELEVSFSESKIDYQTMDKNPTNFIPKEEDFNFVKGTFSFC
ncbi:hypothetical protein DAPPUDRAFT_326877 [Daphnia pulex]|uniref:Uncharacterized protein n=1 Tax=Daphnia pulex TaxID=6669 RepID=E9H919_DAPPU|nr:hypothetical protein DAPPUDRAFT_326877 [Daphnia pulex]|eukprot:EFX71771.1 hypothetical protein DAPPUDRAFT_326877 [Daphnia pulex]